MKKEAVLIGHNFNSILGLARALGSNGFDVGVIRTGKTPRGWLNSLGKLPDKKSRYVGKYLFADSGKPEKLIQILVDQFASTSHKPVLFPVDDISAEILDRHLDMLSVNFHLPNVDHTQGEIIRLMDKHYQKQLARKAGLPVPDGWSIEIRAGKYTLPKELSYPCFVKPETPILGRKNFMGKCNSEQELRAILDKAAENSDCLMLVEEYINIETEYGCVGVCNIDKVCVPGITEKTQLGHGSHAGVTACVKIHLPSDYQETSEKIKTFMSNTRLHGLFDIDLYSSNGILYFNELNVRLGAEGVGTLIAGVNLAVMSADSFLEPEKFIDYNVTAKEITFANEKPLSNDYGEGYITWDEYKNAIKSADYSYIRSNNDRLPYIDYVFSVLRMKRKRARMKS